MKVDEYRKNIYNGIYVERVRVRGRGEGGNWRKYGER
jgi:hypothetical protein